MSFDYTELLDVATDLLAEFGRPMTMIRASRTPAAEDVWLTQQGPAAIAGAQSIPLIGIQSQLDREQMAFQTNERKVGSFFIQADADLPEEVGPDWSLVDGARTYSLISVRPYKPGDTLLVYRLTVAL